MSQFKCEKCGKEFKQEFRLKQHQDRKTPCIKETQKTIEIPKVKPILKWVGGKTQILDKLMKNFPQEINNYHEIFLGGGSVLLALLAHVKSNIIKINGKIYAYDLNEPLIYVYKNIQSKHEELFDKLQEIIKEFNECGKGTTKESSDSSFEILNRKPQSLEEAQMCRENYYYWIRIQYNKLSPIDKQTLTGSAMFIFLNKTCFRGVFRVGPNGFNVPYGHYNSPEIVNKEHLDEIHELIQDVIFECADFNKSLAIPFEDSDYVYLDPPYAPETSTSFVGYTENGFNIDNHQQLFQVLDNLTEKKIKLMMSNAAVTLVQSNFSEPKYNTTIILCKRAINSKNPEAKAKEVIIKNY
jgi:DNA adenine methylase